MLLAGGVESGVTHSDANGAFAFRGLHGAVYEVITPQGLGVYRAWTPGTAPPSARRGVFVIDGQTVTRGRYSRAYDSTIALGALVAAAVAVPVSLHWNNPDESSP